MLLRNHGVVELVVLVVELDDRAWERAALVEPEARRQRACRHIAHHHLERDDLHLADELLAHVEALDEVRRHADLAEALEDVLGDAVVEHALAIDQRVLLGVEGRRVVLEMLDQGPGLRTLVEHLRLALVDATPPVHLHQSFVVSPQSSGALIAASFPLPKTQASVPGPARRTRTAAASIAHVSP